jgi:hypothetical protein
MSHGDAKELPPRRREQMCDGGDFQRARQKGVESFVTAPIHLER